MSGFDRPNEMVNPGNASSGGITSDTSMSETARLIAASKVNGTNVYNRRGDTLGTIYDVMLDKRTGRVEYAVMSFGGFLGIGEHYHPLPWNILEYDERQGGYVVDLDRARLQGAPAFTAAEAATGGYGRQVDAYYAGVATPR